MTVKIGNFLLLEQDPDGKCEMCGQLDELRPYGPKGERICFDCGMKNEPTTGKQFGKLLTEDVTKHN